MASKLTFNEYVEDQEAKNSNKLTNMEQIDSPTTTDLIIRSPPDDVMKSMVSMATEYAWRDESFQKRQICLDEGKFRKANAEKYTKKIYDKMLYHHDKKIECQLAYGEWKEHIQQIDNEERPKQDYQDTEGVKMANLKKKLDKACAQYGLDPTEFTERLLDRQPLNSTLKSPTLFGRARPSFADQLARKTKSGRKEVFVSLSESFLRENPLTPGELDSGETSENDRFSEHELTLTELETDELTENNEQDQSSSLTEITEPVSLETDVSIEKLSQQIETGLSFTFKCNAKNNSISDTERTVGSDADSEMSSVSNVSTSTALKNMNSIEIIQNRNDSMTLAEVGQIIKQTERLVSIIYIPNVKKFETIVKEAIDYSVTVLDKQFRAVKEGGGLIVDSDMLERIERMKAEAGIIRAKILLRPFNSNKGQFTKTTFETIKQLIESHLNTDDFYHENTWNLPFLSGINQYMFALTNPIGREKLVTEANDQFKLSKTTIERLADETQQHQQIKKIIKTVNECIEETSVLESVKCFKLPFYRDYWCFKHQKKKLW